MKNRSILKLTLKKKWFDLMIVGKKNKEFRKPSKWIDSRLIGKSYNFVKFTNGYGNDKPFFYVEYKSFEKSKKSQEFIFDGNCVTVEKGDYIIHLGQIIKNSKFQ